MNRIILFFTLVFLITLSSCKIRSAYGRVMVKTGQKSKTTITVPLDLKQRRLIVLNRTICSNEPYRSNSTDPTVMKIFGEALEYFNTEIKAREFYVYNDEIVEVNSICNQQIYPEPIAEQSIKEFTANENVLLSIEKMKITESDNFRQDIESTYDKNNVLLSRRNVVIGSKFITVTAAIKLYDIFGNIVDSSMLVDNYTYEVKGSNRLNSQSLLRQGQNLAYENIGKKIGFKIADAISPYEVEILRYYFANTRHNEKFNIAEDIIREEGDWESARIIWNEIAELEDDTEDRAKAYFNLGVYHEKNGSFKEAIEALKKSASLNSEVGSAYLNDLKRRYID